MKQPYTLTFTETHWSWAMDDAVASAGGGMEAKRANQHNGVEYRVPWSAVGRIMYCAPQQGLTLLLLPGDKTPPLPLAKLGQRSAEDPMFVTWMVSTAVTETKKTARPGVAALASFEHHLRECTRFCEAHKWPEPQPLEEAEFLARYAPNS
ncbi:uncharacterized protein Tco025E_03221 [Trypanosoma conorhini]|uniref:Uncharacterized protein n=1 Tax=Trypanosoma conorhini TaxID=83891 RepID=A0A3R7L8I0_9TRYP|nr:uncharacterized protein Tco025E_03221 [Trypanosoma conorhini]RNF21891.1 hypothetical protein Tco025E_03221 [Trypanosoma conorhini]